MQQPPRDAGEPLLTTTLWALIAVYGAIISACVLGAMFMALELLDMPPSHAVTVSFLTLALAQLWHVFSMRDAHSGVLRNEIVSNPWVWAALALCVALLLLALELPLPARVLQLRDPGLQGWCVVLGMSLLPALLAPLARRMLVGRELRRTGHTRGEAR
jgi:Ca2+-transporting ATPase